MKLKSLSVVVAAAFCVVFATGCGESPSDVVKKCMEWVDVLMGKSPTDIAEKWMNALLEGDVEIANNYSTSNVHVLNALIIAMIKENDGKSKEQIQKMKDTKFVREEINGDTAKVWAEGDENPVTLKKIDGDWKVHVKK